ncbi:SUMF1/EgtB/PvdO family nonheme iron enzyme [Opitutales bacterium]|nr:SUMF1/EgtB/PvdO family nonheme iron enzyme [Opitutales bacterium]
MKNLPVLIFFLFSTLFLWSANSVPYSGKVSIGGVNYHGDANFTFSLHDGNGTTAWRNGQTPGSTIQVQIYNGRYNVLLGGQGMNALPPQLFLDYDELYLKVRFDNGDGNGLRHLTPDQLITTTPRALVAEVAKVAKVAEKLSGAITSDMLASDVLSKLDAKHSSAPVGPITLSMLAPEVRSKLESNASGGNIGPITRDMLPADVLADLNRTVTHQNLSSQIKADLNRTVTKQMLGQDVLTDLNRTVTKSMLGSDVLADLNRTVTPQMIQSSSITTAQLNEQILKYLKPEITLAPQAPGLIFNGQTITLHSRAEGKYLNYQWYKNGEPIAGADKKRHVIEDVNGTLHDGNYTLVVSNDFGSITTQPTSLVVDGTPTSHTVASISMDMIFCPPGTFTMGSPTSETGRGGDETQHQVTLTNGFYLGKYELTQAQYQTVMNGNSAGLSADPSQFKGSNRPVEKASWEDAQIFLSQLNSIEQTAGRLPNGWKYVLPTEAQWEYACRAGTTTAYSWGNDINSSRANYNWDGGPNDGNDFKQTRDVGQYAANPWGFFDMQGNVWEWVSDWKANYLTGAQTNPEGPASGSYRVKRGGSWNNDGTYLRSAKRYSSTPSYRATGLGFRVGFQPVQPDTANPELELFGGAGITREAGQAWAEPGAAGHDARDGNLTSSISVSGTVDMNTTGTYILTYSVADAAGNTATANRTVTVVGNRSVDLNATVAMDMLWVPAGTFTMGSPTTEAGRNADRENEHNVSLTQGFYLGKYEVTQAQYEAVLGTNPSEFNATGNGNRPVEKVNWTEAVAFCTQLTTQEQAAGRLPVGWAYVLPTESQWEYACRAGTTTAYSWGNTIASSNANWNHGADPNQTVDVGQFSANPWGFFDMHGNVWEWTADWYQATYPTGNPVVDPSGPASGSLRVIRGGSWFNVGASLRSARRSYDPPSRRVNALGFRVGFQQQ